MDRTLSCNSIGCTAVKCTAVFALLTLFHTLFALSGRGLLFRDYIYTHRTVHFTSGSPLIPPDHEQGERDCGDEDILGVKRTFNVPHHHHLRFSEEDGQDHDLNVSTEQSNSWENSTQPQLVSDEPIMVFSPKRTYSPLGEKEVSMIEKFVFFVGYSRSGHSIVASLLDAHPNIIIAHEYNLFRKWKGSLYRNRSFLYNELYQNSYTNAEKGWRSSAKNQKGYTLAMEDSWQGAFEEDRLLVIGEKSGAVTAQTYDNDPWSFIEALEDLRHTVQVPIKVIHVIRNPYDIISTRLLYADGKTRKSKVHATVDMKHVSPRNLSSQVNRTIHLVENVQELLQNCSLDSLEIHTADLVLNPKHVMNNLCMFLGVECSQDYLRKCSDKIFARQSQTRHLVEWPDWLIEKVYQMIIKPYQPFWRYTFTSR